jgi:hypothetical protein
MSNCVGVHAPFHWPDVPADVIAVDDALAVETLSTILIARRLATSARDNTLHI